MDGVATLAQKASRIAALGQLLETFDCREERFNLIVELVRHDFITMAAAHLLMDQYVRGGGE